MKHGVMHYSAQNKAQKLAYISLTDVQASKTSFMFHIPRLVLWAEKTETTPDAQSRLAIHLSDGQWQAICTDLGEVFFCQHYHKYPMDRIRRFDELIYLPKSSHLSYCLHEPGA